MRGKWILLICLAASPLLAGEDGAKPSATPLRQSIHLSELNASKVSALKGKKLEQILTSYEGVDPKVEFTEDNSPRTLTAIIMTYDAAGKETGMAARTFKATGYELDCPLDGKNPGVFVNFRDHLKNVFWLCFRFKSDAGVQAFVANLNQLPSYHLHMGFKVYAKSNNTGDGGRMYGAFITDGGEEGVTWQGPL